MNTTHPSPHRSAHASAHTSVTSRAASTPRRPVHPWARNDDGSMLLVIMFTFMMAALILVITASAITGLAKSRDSREYAVAFQAADSAIAHALATANRGQLPNLAIGQSHTSPATTVGNVTWQWTATKASNTRWDLTVHAASENMSRQFSATLKGTSVDRGAHDTATGTLRYVANQDQYWSNGYFGTDALTVTSGTPIIDGYFGESGRVGSNGNFTLGTAQLDRMDQWNWDGVTPRCTGDACATTEILPVKSVASFPSPVIEDVCADPANQRGAWVASLHAYPPVAGGCYDSLDFDVSRTADAALPQPVYVRGPVTVRSGVAVNLTTGSHLKATSGLRIATTGTYTQQAGTTTALAVFARGACTVQDDTTSQTLWLGSATCKNIDISGDPRLRVDGSLSMLTSGSTGQMVWNLYDYRTMN